MMTTIGFQFAVIRSVCYLNSKDVHQRAKEIRVPRSTTTLVISAFLVSSAALTVATADDKDQFPHLWSSGAATDRAWEHPPKDPRNVADPVIRLEQMKTFFDPPGEYGFYTAGPNYGFETLAIVISDTLPNAGPPLHLHSVEEAHVVLEGSVRYMIGGKTFTATGPFVVRIPAGVPHAFLNVGTKPIHVIGVLPSTSTRGDKELGPNPLLPKR